MDLVKVLLFTLIFALTSEVGLAQTTASAFSATINDLRLGSTATEITFTFTMGSVTPDTKNITIKAETGDAPSPADIPKIWSTNAPACTIVVASSGALVATQPTFAAVDSTDTSSGTNFDSLTITAVTTSITAVSHVVRCTTNINANAAVFRKVTFSITSDVSGETALETQTGWIVGIISPYYKMSECRTGGLATGALINCVQNTNPCETCSTTFVTSTGLQQESTSCTSGAQVRCDSLYSAHDSIDIAFTTNGNTGVAVCGAFALSATAPSANLLYMTVGSGANDIRSKNQVKVTEREKTLDHVITLNGLNPHTQYEIYCHMDQVEMSEMLKVWTEKNLDIWDITLTPNVLTASPSTTPTQMVLSFYHGMKLTGNATSSITTITLTTSQNIWAGSGSTVTTCNLLSDGSQVTQFSATASNEKTMVFSILASGASEAGSKVVITCTSNLAANYATGAVLINTLEVKDATYTHKTARKIAGFTTV